MEDNRVNCNRCKYFYVTWDNDFPKGCRLYGLKSRSIPSMLVKKESGLECLGFVEKENLKKETLDLNRDDLW